MNDRLGLPQIEALGDTLSADTEQQRRLAVRGASDALLNRYELWRQQLLYARGCAFGAPNAGKSSLLNRIVGKEAAIVSTEEGTTRDIVDVGIDLGGWYCKLGDMAGIRAEAGTKSGSIVGAVEKEGIRRARARALESDVVVVVLSLEETTQGVRLFVEPEVLDAVNDCVKADKCLVIAINKCDKLSSEKHELPALTHSIRDVFPAVPTERIFAISCDEAERGPLSSETDPGHFTSIPTRAHLNIRSESESKFASIDGEIDIVTAAEHLRFAADMLAKITGKGESGDVEDVLGVVFEK
ncbi:tRNA modification GTPase MnmE [Penicillium maclennaniae]|uniref:tRNA modification GTPase MnmE n=1 Tax=Penicillium maclennaniae TaxID=1343394 RepID=UPI0025426A0F|nr:tRNA modification GTPase MnmE [Penicillium maclennaniae]KAJ5674826.1 tRNA modification GTPase MnmE [Penicillium maclennaniae]